MTTPLICGLSLPLESALDLQLRTVMNSEIGTVCRFRRAARRPLPCRGAIAPTLSLLDRLAPGVYRRDRPQAPAAPQQLEGSVGQAMAEPQREEPPPAEVEAGEHEFDFEGSFDRLKDTPCK